MKIKCYNSSINNSIECVSDIQSYIELESSSVTLTLKNSFITTFKNINSNVFEDGCSVEYEPGIPPTPEERESAFLVTKDGNYIVTKTGQKFIIHKGN